MRSIFVSCVESGWYCLEELFKQKADILAIFTLKDEYTKDVSGYKSFEDLSSKYHVPLFKVKNINDTENIKRIEELKPDLIFVIGWSQLVKKEVIDLPKIGCIGMHPTLLPKNRGRAPIPWTIIHGLKRSGVTMFYIDKGVDSGDIIAQKEFGIDERETAMTLYKKVLSSFVSLIKDTYPLLVKGTVDRKPQNEEEATYWPKRTPEDGKIDWSRSSEEIDRLIRAITHPYPGAFSFIDGKKILIWESNIHNKTYKDFKEGAIVNVGNNGFIVKTKDKSLLILKAQIEGGEGMFAIDLFKKNNLKIGDELK